MSSSGSNPPGNRTSSEPTPWEFRKLIGREFEAQAVFFEDVLVLVLPSAQYEAVFASFDREGPLPMDELVSVAADVEG